jgi:hypothetical protein
LRLFQSIFGGGETRGRYPDALIDMAIERAVDATDSRLRLVPGYRKRLRPSIIQAIDHVVTLVGAIPPPCLATAVQHGAEPCLSAVFASAGDMLEILGRDPALRAFLETPTGRGAEQVTALLLAERVERQVLGLDLVDDQVRRDVAQVAISFTGHRLIDPSPSESESRRLWTRRAFDHILTLALGRMTETRIERADLQRERDLLQRKLTALQSGGWSFVSSETAPSDPVALQAEIDGLTSQIDALGPARDVLNQHLDILITLLGDAARQLWAESVSICVDALNIQRLPQDSTARIIPFVELRNARSRSVTLLALDIRPSDLSPRLDLVSAAERYLQ